jgi:hypothetical protein
VERAYAPSAKDSRQFGGGSIRGDDGVETADLIHRGLVTRNGLTRSGLEVFKAALKSRYETGRTEAP